MKLAPSMNFVAVVAGIVVLVLITGVVMAWPTMLLWNWLMPDIFGLKKIDFWQALGLLVLSGFLFKGAGLSSSKN